MLEGGGAGGEGEWENVMSGGWVGWVEGEGVREWRESEEIEDVGQEWDRH